MRLSNCVDRQRKQCVNDILSGCDIKFDHFFGANEKSDIVLILLSIANNFTYDLMASFFEKCKLQSNVEFSAIG